MASVNAASVVPAVAAPRARRSLPDLIERERQRTRRRRIAAWLAVVVVIALSAVAATTLRPRPAPLAERFRTVPASVGDVTRTVQATGHVEALTTVLVGAEVSGRIASVDVDYNDTVKAGQVLARFDRASLAAQAAQAQAILESARAAVEQAKVDREQAQRNFARAQQLHAKGNISESDYESATTAAHLAERRVQAAESQRVAQEAAYQVARTNLTHSVIVSPIDGIVVTRNIDPGQTVASVLQTPVLFTVAADLEKMRVVAAVDEADVGEVKEGQRATFSVNAYPSRTFEGVVTQVRNAAAIVQDVVTYGTVIGVDNADLALKPGMTASVRVITATAKNVLRVPNAALQFTPPGEASRAAPGVWTLEAGALAHLDARPGVSDGELTAIESGSVATGTPVLVELTPRGRQAYGLAH